MATFYCEKRDIEISLAACVLSREEASLGSPCEGCEDWKEHMPKDVMNVGEVVQRMMSVAEVKSKVKLGQIVGGNIYQAEKSGKLPERWFEVFRDKYGVDREWLLTGNGVLRIKRPTTEEEHDMPDPAEREKPVTDKSVEESAELPPPTDAKAGTKSESGEEAMDEKVRQFIAEQMDKLFCMGGAVHEFGTTLMDGGGVECVFSRRISIEDIPTEDLFKELARRVSPEGTIVITGN